MLRNDNESKSAVSPAPITFKMNQGALEQVLQAFLAQLTFIDPRDNCKKQESLPTWALQGLCNGYSIMGLRAHSIGEGNKHQQRLKTLAQLGHGRAVKMGRILQKHREQIENSLGPIELRISNSLRQFKRKHLTLLFSAQELYVFIQSLLFAHLPGSTHEIDFTFPDGKHQEKLKQSDFIEILKVIPPDKFITKDYSGEKGRPKEIVTIPFKLDYLFPFTLTREEFVRALTSVMHDGDMVLLTNPYHVTRLLVNSTNSDLSFVDPEDHSGTLQCSSYEDLVKADFFSETVNDYLALVLTVYSTQPRKRPLPAELATRILDSRDKDISIDVRGTDECSTAFMAAEAGCNSILMLALERGANPQLDDSEHFTPAVVAAANGHSSIIRILAAHNVELSKTNHNKTVKSAAQGNFRHETANTIDECLYDQCLIDFDDWESERNLPALMELTPQELKVREEKPEKMDQYYIKLLSAVRAKKLSEIRKMLVDNPDEDFRKVAIYFVVMANTPERNLLQAICEKRANHGQQMRYYSMAFLMAARKNQAIEALYLLEKYAHSFTIHQLGLGLLYLVNDKEYVVAKKLLIKRPDADKTWIESEVTGNNPLHLAVLQGADVETIRLLCMQNNNIGALNANGKDALHLAVENRHYPAIICLLMHHAKHFSTTVETACLKLIEINEQQAKEGYRKALQTFLKNARGILSTGTCNRAQLKFTHVSKLTFIQAKKLHAAKAPAPTWKKKLAVC